MAGVGAIIQGLAEMGTNMINSAGLAVNKRTADSNARFQERAALANLLLQAMSWKREDSAVQRRVRDLRAAGLSPTLAAGSAAQSSPAQRLEAPQNTFDFPMNAIRSNVGQLIMEASLANSQIQKMDAEKQRIDTLTFIDLLSYPKKLANLDARTNSVYQDVVEKQLNNYKYKMTGQGPKSGTVGKTVADTWALIETAATQAGELVKGNKKQGTFGGQ